MSPVRVDAAMPGSRTSRPDVRLAVPALSAWAGAFVATSGQFSGALLVGIFVLLVAAAAVASLRSRWAAVACSLALSCRSGHG
jgi:hypothetical protein